MRVALVAVVVVLAGCSLGGGGSSSATRYNTAGTSDEPTHGRAVLAGGAVEYELTAWHLGTGTHLDATIRNRGPGVLRVDPARATLATAAGEAIAATPSGCGVCPGNAPCPQAASAAATRELAPGETRRIVRCFAAVNPWAGRHEVSGADPRRLALRFRDDGIALDGAPLVAEIELTRR